jgi:Pectate lyase superfamily protein
MSLSELTPQDFGALGDGSHNDTNAVSTCVSTALANGRNVFFPAGQYNVTTTILADLSTLHNSIAGSVTTGVTIYGEGQQSILNLTTANSTAPLFAIQYNGSSPPSPNYPPPTVPPPANPYYSFHMRDLQLVGSACNTQYGPTAILQLGREDYRDTLNGCHFTNLVVHNNATSGACGTYGAGPAVFVGFVQNSRIEGTFTSAGANGLWISSAQYCRFLVSCLTGAGQAALYLNNSPNSAAAFCAGNLFLNADCEGGGTSGSVGILISGSQCYNNVFVAPYINNVATGISATAGSSNRVIQPYYNSNVSTDVGSTTGLTIN